MMGAARPKVDEFLLGYVDDPLPGHESYKGMLAIPYIRPTFDGELLVATIRFRCLLDHEHEFHGKYNTMPGDRRRMYNTRALVESNHVIGITEGEMDTITLELCGLPAVGIPGVQGWNDAFREPFLGYEKVYIFGDGDKPGREFATKMASELRNGVIVPMPDGEDVNSFVLNNGVRELKGLIK